MSISERLERVIVKVNLVTVYQLVKKVLRWRRRRIIHGLGYVPDAYDDRDIVYKIKKISRELPPSTYLANISKFPWRYNQGNLGSCVGHGVTAAFRRVLQVHNMPDFEPSRLFAYYISRSDKKNDTGASIRDAFKAMNKWGLCAENTWPYIECRFAKQPSEIAFREAEDHQVIRYERLCPVSKDAIRDAVSAGYPVVYGKMIYESFMTDAVARNGIVPLPDLKREQFYGGHCMTIFDYDEHGTIELNSWGESWGLAGICRVPWDFVLNEELSKDFWVIFFTE